MKKNLSDFSGQVNRRPAIGYEVDTTENSIAADSPAMMDQSRIRTMTAWEPDAKMRKAQNTSRGVYPVPMSGTFVERPVNVMEGIKRNMGKQVYRSAQKSLDQE